MPLLVGDVTAVLDEMGIRRTHLLGYSMGGGIGWGMAKFAPDRLVSLAIGGQDAEDPDPDHPSAGTERMMELLRGGRESALNAFKKLYERELQTADSSSFLTSILPQRLALIADSDPEALLAMLRWSQKEQLAMREVLPHLAFPCLVFAGEKDSCVEGARLASLLIPHGRFVSLPGLGHIEAGHRSELVAPLVLRFLQEVDRDDGL